MIQQEKEKQELISDIENFNPAKLKHAETLEKNPLPTKEGELEFEVNILLIKDNIFLIKMMFFFCFSNRRRKDSCLKEAFKMKRTEKKGSSDSSFLPFSIS